MLKTTESTLLIGLLGLAFKRPQALKNNGACKQNTIAEELGALKNGNKAC